VLASRPFLLRGEDFGTDAWSTTEYDQGYRSQLLVSFEWFHAAVPTPFVAKLTLRYSGQEKTPENRAQNTPPCLNSAKSRAAATLTAAI